MMRAKNELFCLTGALIHCIIFKLQFKETYRSGHNGADSKSVGEQSHVGSNPTVSARKETPFVYWTKGVSFQ